MTGRSQVPKSSGVITVNSAWDTTIRVTDGSGSRAEYKVKRSSLENNSDYFRKLFDPASPFGGAKSGSDNIFYLREDTGATTSSLDLLFHCVDRHGKDCNKTQLPDIYYKYTIDEIWRVLTLVTASGVKHVHKGKYLISADVLKPWFARWYMKNSERLTEQHEYQQLLYPAYVLDKADGHMGPFAKVTKWLIYHGVGQIKEKSPLVGPRAASYFVGMHMPPDVINQLRRARSHLRLEVASAIDSSRALLVSKEHRCSNRVEAYTNMMEALRRTGVYPVEDFNNKEFVHIAERIEDIRYQRPRLGSCYICRDPDDSICSVAAKQRTEMGGLCLECMEASVSDIRGLYMDLKPKGNRSDDDDDYIKRPCGWHGWGTWRFSHFNHVSRS